MKQILKEYKTQIAIIIGALIVGSAMYFGITKEHRDKVNACIKFSLNKLKSRGKDPDLFRVRDFCENQILRYGRW